MTANLPTPKDRRPKALGTARAHAIFRSRVRLVPYTHQADGLATLFASLDRYGSFGLLHDMGCGKTLTMLAALLEMHNEGKASSMFVACPSTVVPSWGKECAGINARAGRAVIECLELTQSSVPKREAALTRRLLERDVRAQGGEDLPPLVVVLNTESTWRMEHLLRASKFDIAAVDESQRIKAPGSKQSLAMYRIGKGVKFCVLMTGTPVPEGGLDWYGQWRFADPTLLGTNFTDFKARFAIEIECETKDGKKFRKVVVNPHTKSTLEGLVMPRVHRVSKADAVDLPPATPTEITFDLTPRQRKIYDDLVRDSLALIERQVDRQGRAELARAMGVDVDIEIGEVLGDNVLTRMLRLRQITGGYVQVDGVQGVEPADPKSNPKLSALADLAETLRDVGSKLVIFHQFTHEGLAIEKLCQRLSGKANPISVINGRIPGSDRGRMVAEFQEGDALFFIGQIQACAEGITLHAASDSAMYSLPHASAIYLQALARIDRIGQTEAVTNHHLIANNTIDRSIYEAQQRKRDAAEDAVDGGWKRFLEGSE